MRRQRAAYVRVPTGALHFVGLPFSCRGGTVKGMNHRIERERLIFLGTRSDRAAAPGLEAAEAELAAATRATGVVAIEPRRALGRRRTLDAGRAIHRERGVFDVELVVSR